MAEDRPAELETDAIGRISKDLDDLRSTILARQSRQPTGTIELTLLAAPKPDQLFFLGQVLNRVDYPTLVQWIIDNSLFGAGLFGTGDGSTTFGIPNWQGRCFVMAGTLGADTYAVGATGGATLTTIALANMPVHGHSVSVNTHGTHGHPLTGGTVPSGGNHGGHFPAGSHLAAAGPDLGLAAWNDGGSDSGNHGHGAVVVTADAASAGSHTVVQSNAGSGTAVDTRDAYIAVNFAIWT